MSVEQSDERRFKIEVENEFDEEKRSLKGWHHHKGGQKEEFSIDWDEPQQQQSPPRPRIKFTLSFGDVLEVNVGDLGKGGRRASRYWYVKLPIVADFKFLWKDEKNIPITYKVYRDESTGGRTRIYFPPELDPRDCILLIAPPGRLEENYQPENLTGILVPNGGGSPDDNVSVGDNGP